MTKKIDLSKEKMNKYLQTLVPRLSKYSPGEWVKIADIANDISEFIDIVEFLCNEGHFNDADGYCIIDIKEDSLVKLDTEYLRLLKQEKRQ